MIRVLAVTCTRHRPLMLRHTILQMQHQTYPVDHVIYINSNENEASDYTTDYTRLIDDITPVNRNQIFIKFGDSFYQHRNHIEAIKMVDIEQYDLFIKVDDDDIYRSFYVEEVVADFKKNRWDLSGSHCYGIINGYRWETEAILKNMGLDEGKKDVGVASTWAFSRDAIKAIRTIDDKLPGFEDNLWKKCIEDESDLIMHCRSNPSRNYHYHIHGGNISTASWLKECRPEEKQPNELSVKSMTGFQALGQSLSSLKYALPLLPKDILAKVLTSARIPWGTRINKQLMHQNRDNDISDPTPLVKLLSLCARPTGHPEMYAKLSERAAGINDWSHLPHLAEQHGLAPLAYYRLREAKIEIPTAVKRTLKGAYLTHRHANRERMSALKEIATVYRENNVKMLALKGAALANTVYPDIALRCMCDLDLMVPDDTADNARSTLETLGFNIQEKATVQPRAFSHHFPPALRDQNGVSVMVELHHHLYSRSKLVPSVTLDKLRPDAISFELDKTPVDTLGPEQMLWHSYIHAVGKLQLVEQFRLIHVADLIGLVETYANRIDWHRLVKHYKQTYHAIMMLHLFSPWSQAVKNELPFDCEATFNFKDFPNLPSAMGVSSRDRKAWIPRFFKDTLLPPDWWVCFFQGNHPVKFNTLNYRVVYPLRRISAFWGNLAGFYIRKGYRKWSRAGQMRD